MALELEGKVKIIFDTQTFDSGFSKREFVVTTQEQYPQDIKLECIKDKTSLLDNLNVNDDVKVSFNLRGNEYNGKYYVNLQAWRVEPATQGSANNTAPLPTANDAPAEPDDATDDLPF